MLTNAKWIKSPIDMATAAVEFRRSFSIKNKVKSAILYISSAGIYSPKLNGKKITDAVLMPGITSYKTRILYQEYDVTEFISESNELSFGVGPGWAVGHYGYSREKQLYFDEIALILRILILRERPAALLVVGATGHRFCFDQMATNEFAHFEFPPYNQ